MKADRATMDRRKHKRYEARADAFAVLNPRSRQPCHIIDISKGGLSFCYSNNNNTWLDDEAELDIYLGDDEFCLNRLPVETVADYLLPAGTPAGSLALNQRCVKFGNLSPQQLCALTYFIEANSREAEELERI